MPLPLLLALLAPTARAAGPTGTFPDCTAEDRGSCPNDLSWREISWIPDSSADTVHAGEAALGSGIRLDQALRQESGRWDVQVAIIDSGIDWADREVAGKVWLNTGELPLAQRSDGTPVEGGDLDGNSIINVWDYAEDPRVDPAAGIDRADDRLDPSDLLAAFSDGVDDDGNGYVDDIAGWDFHEHDNDPYAGFRRGFWDHGTGVAKTAASWADDGGTLGACPDCSVVPLRIGEAFVTDGDRLALALAYAGDLRAGAASLAVGGITHPDSARRAAAYAAERGVVLVGAGGDENAYHRNLPAGDPSFLFVKSVRANDRRERGGARSFLATWNCNNFGPRMDLVAPATECATGATAKIAGLAALLHAAARNRGRALSAADVRALLRASATDVALPPDVQGDLELLPSRPGWDAYHGYGRVDAELAVTWVTDGVGAGSRLEAPAWFSWSRDGRVRVRGWSASPWHLEAGAGAEPDTWEELASGDPGDIDLEVELPRDDPEFGDLDLGDDLLARVERAHRPLVQLRLRGGAAEERTAVWVHDDPDLLPGFPVTLTGSVDSGANLADLDEDGVFEVIVASSSGRVRVLDGAGRPVPGWDGHETDPHPHRPAPPAWAGVERLPEGLLGTPAVGDLDGDGTPEIVAGGLAGGLYRFDAEGSRLLTRLPRPETPLPEGVTWDAAILGSPVLVRLRPDDVGLHIVVGDAAQRVWVFDAEGRPVDGYPLRICHPDVCETGGARIVATPSVADVDGDGALEAIVPTGEVPDGAAGVVHIVDLAEARLEASLDREGLVNSTLLPVIGEGHPGAVALGDLDGDGDLELATAAMLSNDPPVHHTGDDAIATSFAGLDHGPRSNLDSTAAVQMAHAPALGDLDGDGVPDVVTGAATLDYILSLARTRYGDHQHGLFAFSGATGEALPGFPRQVDGPALLTAPALADVTGDGLPEVLATSTSHLLYAHDAQGTLAPGFPKFHGGWAMGGPAVGDIDGDGYLDVIVTTRDGLVFAWRTDGPADGPTPWPLPHHDAGHTGSLTTPRPVQTGPPDAAPDEGCGGCAGGPGPLWIGWVFLALARRRPA